MKVIKNAKPVELTYEEICQEIGAIPKIKFVHVTTRGTISFSCGKPNEIRWLKKQCEKMGFRMSKKLKNA